MAILELSKTLMLDFHYGYTKPKWGDRASLLMIDTDSFIYEIQTDDFLGDIAGDVPTWFDTSNFPKEDHPSGIVVGQNKKVVGLMKSETGGEVIHEFVGLRAKLYALTTDKKVEKKAKGVKSGVVKSGITFDDYKQCVVSGKTKTVKMNVIRSREHTLFTESIQKKALDANDDKRYIVPNDPEHRTLAWGHHRLRK